VRDGGAAVGALCAVGPRMGEGELRLLAGLADAAGSLLGRARAQAALREAEARAERARAVAVEREGLATLGHLAACVTHEIAGPLGCLGSNLRAALEGAEELERLAGAGPEVERGREAAAELKQLLREATGDVARVVELARSLRSISRQTAEERIRFDPRESVEDAVRIFRGARRLSGGVALSAPARLPEVEGSPGLLCQVVLNLLDNALDAAEGRGPVEVRLAEEPGGRVSLEVADRGSGIPPEIRERVFDAYFTTKPPGRGTGLGLYICRDVVERMGGRISFVSGGGGTTFRVELPPAP
jgi:signal transduction histidine kinase